MDYKEFIDTVLSDVGADDRVKNGVIDLENPEHLSVLREYVVDYTDDEFADMLFSELIDEGNYPERQAYNENGILVTFPDSESKKAAIERGTHFENPPGGVKKEKDSDEPSDDEEEQDVQNVFSTTETPEQKRKREKQEFEISPTGTNLTPDDIKFVEDDGSESQTTKERNRLYDILQGIKSSKEVPGYEGESFTLDKLDPSVLFALSEKWVFDKSGDWYNEEGKFRGNTDKKGHVHPSRPQDKEKMEMWIEDHEKRKAGIEISDEN